MAKRFLWALALIVVLVLAMTHLPAQADDSGFRWFVDCAETLNGQAVLWIGYIASEDLPGATFSYSGNGPGVYMGDPVAGEHHKAVAVLRDYGPVTLWLYPDGDEITVDAVTPADECAESAETGLLSGHLDMSPSGEVNNPVNNPDANACYSSGVVCNTPEEWERGYYQIRKAYGLI